tara:strand:- start:222 stop:524 length:303 start_codon:yes stop_codon:yes gene_type:complete
MFFDFKTVIRDYCGKGKLSEEEIDFLESEHIRIMSSIGEIISPSIANLNICEACNLEPGSFWITCNASILDQIRPVKTGKPRSYKLFDALCKYQLFNPKA